MAACRITIGDPCTVQHSDTPVTLALTNAIDGTAIVSTTIESKNQRGGPATRGTIAQDGTSVQIPISTPDTYLVTAMLNQVKPSNPNFSVSLDESCTNGGSVILFLDAASKLGQVTLEVQ